MYRNVIDDDSLVTTTPFTSTTNADAYTEQDQDAEPDQPLDLDPDTCAECGRPANHGPVQHAHLPLCWICLMCALRDAVAA